MNTSLKELLKRKNSGYSNPLPYDYTELSYHINMSARDIPVKDKQRELKYMKYLYNIYTWGLSKIFNK